jgi:DnaK suppressor protein
LHNTLVARQADLLKKLHEDLGGLRNQGADPTGDRADAAFEAGSDEMAAQLAELDARELSQVECVLARLKQGTYGVCEGCHDKIPVGRLNALPYTTLCINCQRERERDPGWEERRSAASWERAYDAVTPLEEGKEIDLSETGLPDN